MEAPKVCPQCGGEIINKKGTSQKTGKPYSFWGCKNYPQCKFIWHEPKNAGSNVADGNAIVIEELADFRSEVNKRLDELIAYVVKNLPEKDVK